MIRLTDIEYIEYYEKELSAIQTMLGSLQTVTATDSAIRETLKRRVQEVREGLIYVRTTLARGFKEQQEEATDAKD